MAFTSTWSTISSAQADADSPLDVTLMEGIRQNLIHLYEWLGQGYTPSTAHNHNGVNSANVILGTNSVNSSAIVANSVTSTKLGSTSVELSHLKFTQGSWTSGSSYIASDIITVDIAQYSHNFTLRMNDPGIGGGYVNQTMFTSGTVADNVDSGNIRRAVLSIVKPDVSGVVYFYWDYHSS